MASSATASGPSALGESSRRRRLFEARVRLASARWLHTVMRRPPAPAAGGSAAALRPPGSRKVASGRWETALFWLLEVMGLEHQEVLPLYIGDDVTDEDAFTALRHTGIGIIVSAGSEHATAAHYRLDDTPEVRTFLQRLTERRQRSQQP